MLHSRKMLTTVVRKIYIISVCILLTGVSFGQLPTVLTLAPDGRSTGMADMGVATSADANAQYFNVSKYAFAGKGGLSLSYAPWMRKLTPDMNKLHLAGFAQVGNNNYFSGAVSYFSIGDITLSDGNNAVTRNPAEWAVGLGYARRLTPYLSLGMAFRYVSAVYADLNVLGLSSAGAFAADVGAYFQHAVGKDHISAGLSFTNIGTQFDFGDNKASLPTALRLGVFYTFNLTPGHALGLGAEGNMPLTGVGDNLLNKTTVGFGTEYSWNNLLMARAGYFYNNKRYGDRLHWSFGLGGRYKMFGLDGSYWLPFSSNSTALDNTFHLTLTCFFE